MVKSPGRFFDTVHRSESPSLLQVQGPASHDAHCAIPYLILLVSFAAYYTIFLRPISAATLQTTSSLLKRNPNPRILLVCVIMLLRHYSSLLFYNQAFCVHHPQNNPITIAYKLRPYVAMMFRNIRRLGDMSNVANVANMRLLPTPIFNGANRGTLDYHSNFHSDIKRV